MVTKTADVITPADIITAHFDVVKDGVGNKILASIEPGVEAVAFKDEVSITPADVNSAWPSADGLHTFARIVITKAPYCAKTFQLDVPYAVFVAWRGVEC